MLKAVTKEVTSLFSDAAYNARMLPTEFRGLIRDIKSGEYFLDPENEKSEPNTLASGPFVNLKEDPKVVRKVYAMAALFNVATLYDGMDKTDIPYADNTSLSACLAISCFLIALRAHNEVRKQDAKNINSENTSDKLQTTDPVIVNRNVLE